MLKRLCLGLRADDPISSNLLNFIFVVNDTKCESSRWGILLPGGGNCLFCCIAADKGDRDILKIVSWKKALSCYRGPEFVR